MPTVILELESLYLISTLSLPYLFHPKYPSLVFEETLRLASDSVPKRISLTPMTMGTE